MTMLTKLADVLSAAGVTVAEVDGWKTRGRPFVKIRGLVCHHTGPGSLKGHINVVRDGRSDLPGPLSQIVLDEDGTAYIIAAGRANHSGRGNWHGVTNGNGELIGVEARNAGDGKDRWEPAQMEAYAKIAAACAKHYGFPALMVCGHKEWALPKGRKIDPTFDMVEFRGLVAELMAKTATPAEHLPPRPATVATLDPRRAMLRRGDEGQSVMELQQRLRALGYKVAANGIFSWETLTRVKEFQVSKGLAADGMVGPKTWAELLKGA